MKSKEIEVLDDKRFLTFVLTSKRSEKQTLDFFDAFRADKI